MRGPRPTGGPNAGKYRYFNSLRPVLRVSKGRLSGAENSFLDFGNDDSVAADLFVERAFRHAETRGGLFHVSALVFEHPADVPDLDFLKGQAEVFRRAGGLRGGFEMEIPGRERVSFDEQESAL